MRAREGVPGAYTERDPAPERGLDAALATLGYRWHRAFSARLDGEALAVRVRAGLPRLASRALRECLPELRYRLRKHGFGGSRTVDCLALCAAALWQDKAARAAPACFAAADALLRGHMAMLAGAGARTDAVLLAACAMAIAGAPVHLAAATDARAAKLAQALQVPLLALGMRATAIAPGMDLRERHEAYGAEVACAALRELVIDYLRDRLRRGRARGALREHVARIAEEGRDSAPLLLRGLHCLLVDEADAVMIDGALAPVAISREAAPTHERLPLEQALELARALQPGRDFVLETGEARLTSEGAERVARLAAPLDALRQPGAGREALVASALFALHGLDRGRDYAVEEGRVLRPDVEPQAGEPGTDPGLLQALLELKERCPLSGRREIQARISIPAFLRRYLRLAGVCRPDPALPGEFWVLYGCKTDAGARQVRAEPCAVRAFATSEARRAALMRAVSDALRDGEVLVALRSREEGQAFREALGQGGLAGRVSVTLFPAHREAQAGAWAEARPRLLVGDLHDAARHVEEIREACGARSCCQFVSLDEPAAARLGASAGALARAGSGAQGELAPDAGRWIARSAQQVAERAAAAMRQDAQRRERQLDTLFAFTGGAE